MKKMSDKNFFYVFLGLFIVLNIFNSYVVTTNIFNPGMNLYKFTFETFLTSIFGDLGFLLLILVFFLFITRRKKATIISLTIVTALLSTVILLLKIHSFYYGTAFSFLNLRSFTNDAPILGKQLTLFMTKNIIQMGNYVALIPAIVLIIFTILTFKQGRFSNEELSLQSNKRGSMFYFKLLIIGLSFHSLSIIKFHYESSASESITFVDDLEAIQNMGVYTYLATDLFGYITNPNQNMHTLNENLIERGYLYLEDQNNKNVLNFFNEKTNNTSSIFKDKNLVILQLESFNNFLINLKIEDKENNTSYEVTPFINSLANNDKNLYYPNFYANVGVGKTSDAEFSTLTGLVPNGNIVTYYDYINQDYETLPKLFTKKGYETYNLTGSHASFYKRDEVYPLLGFNPNNYSNQESFTLEGRFNIEDETHYINGWVDDDIVFDKLIDILKKDEKQFIFGMSTILHSPYANHDFITGVNEWKGIIDGQMSNYLDYARYFDNALQRFYESLIINNLLEDTVFIMYGDHKSDLPMKEHVKLFPEANDLMANQKLSHNVPLIIIGDTDLSPYKESTSLVRSQRDLKRTISNLFDLNQTYYFGVDILTLDKTIAYVPLTMDIFTDEFHLNYRGKKASIDLNDEEMLEFKVKFDKFKIENDLLLLYKFFGELDYGT